MSRKFRIGGHSTASREQCNNSDQMTCEHWAATTATIKSCEWEDPPTETPSSLFVATSQPFFPTQPMAIVTAANSTPRTSGKKEQKSRSCTTQTTLLRAVFAMRMNRKSRQLFSAFSKWPANYCRAASETSVTTADPPQSADHTLLPLPSPCGRRSGRGRQSASGSAAAADETGGRPGRSAW